MNLVVPNKDIVVARFVIFASSWFRVFVVQMFRGCRVFRNTDTPLMSRRSKFGADVLESACG
jgi:hypothetical protein